MLKNIIFDLGGVIINIDVIRTAQAFAKMTGKPLDEVQERIAALNIFYKYEVGELNDESFRELIRGFLEVEINDAEIDKAWNTLLLDIPKERIELLTQLKTKYRLFMLSNTNFIHYKEVENILQKNCGLSSFSEIFEKIYLSYEINYCKPDKQTYEYVLNDKKLLAEDTLFIDDNLSNIEAASLLGINTIHLQPPDTILDIFNGEKFS